LSNTFQHTLGHVFCPACENLKNSLMREVDFGELTFPEAARIWIDSRVRLSPGSVRDYKAGIKALTPFFGLLRLKDIHIGHISAYQSQRKQRVIRCNRELGVILAQIMYRAGLWDDIKKFYEPLPIPRTKVGIALEPEEEKELFRIAAANPRWLVTYCASLLARNTCMGTQEVRRIRLMDIDLKELSWIKICDRVKNDFRIRTLKCNHDARWALRQLLDVAYDKGASDPEHFIIPHRAENGSKGPDFTRPIFSFYKSWYAIRTEAAKKFPRLARLRFYDMRHTANTRLLENPDVPYNVIEHYMGHRVGSETKRIYDHMRDSNISKGSEALSSGHAEEVREIQFTSQKRGPFLVQSNCAKKAGG
jgi:integrase